MLCGDIILGKLTGFLRASSIKKLQGAHLCRVSVPHVGSLGTFRFVWVNN